MTKKLIIVFSFFLIFASIDLQAQNLDPVKIESSTSVSGDTLTIMVEFSIEENKETDLNLNFTEKEVDELYEKAVTIIIEQQKVSTSFVQRYLQIGYNRAARIIEKMEEDGYISEASHAGKRSVLKKNK